VVAYTDFSFIKFFSIFWKQFGKFWEKCVFFSANSTIFANLLEK